MCIYCRCLKLVASQYAICRTILPCVQPGNGLEPVRNISHGGTLHGGRLTNHESLVGGEQPNQYNYSLHIPQTGLRTPGLTDLGKGNFKKVVISRLVDASQKTEPLESYCESYQLVGSSFRTWIRYVVSYPT